MDELVKKANVAKPTRRAKVISTSFGKVKVAAVSVEELLQSGAYLYVAAKRPKEGEPAPPPPSAEEMKKQSESSLSIKFGLLAVAVLDGDDEQLFTMDEWKIHSTSREGKADVDLLSTEAKSINANFFEDDDEEEEKN